MKRFLSSISISLPGVATTNESHVDLADGGRESPPNAIEQHGPLDLFDEPFPRWASEVVAGQQQPVPVLQGSAHIAERHHC